MSFLGSQSEMVVSGSDCGNIFIWDTDTGDLINMFLGDSKGAVNCLTSVHAIVRVRLHTLF